MMGRNIVLCSDGTGNTFDRSVSNVTRLVKLLALDNRAAQVVAYDQGIGTNARRHAAVTEYRETIRDRESLRVLDGPKEWRFQPAGWPVRLVGLVGGYGLKANVRELYHELTRLYDGPTDKILLFGFSRGAFTVRALAGLLYRCWLPGKKVTDFKACFEEAWRLYQPHCEDEKEIGAFRKRSGGQQCPIHFLGLWDTVKSYGGLIPVSLPHLRHNPIVQTVRHALALNERRSWFNATTWGQLDSDEKGAKQRLKSEDLSSYESQDIAEVWFRGCHSDVGGGDVEEVTARIALRWMLAEAADPSVGLSLNEHGKAVLEGDDPQEPEIHESLRRLWWLTEFIPRKEIDNSGLYPVRKPAFGRTGTRNPDKLRRKGKVFVHTSVDDRQSIPPPVEPRQTKSLPR
jgi:uncharacterized protein (DUF2235 family)